MAIYGITIQSDSATPFLRRFRKAMDGRSYLPPIGEAGKGAVMENFQEKNRTDAHKSASRINAKPSQLYGEFARATNWRGLADTVFVSVNHVAARQRYLGGTIRPVNAGALTIPARAEAYGVYADQVGVDLKFGYAPDPETGKWRPALIAYEPGRKATKRKRKDGSAITRIVKPAGVYYWLVRSVTMAPDESVLPTDKVFDQWIEFALLAWLDDLKGGQS